MEFFALKISDPKATDLVRIIKSGGDDFNVQQLNQLEERLVVGNKVFIQLGGDRVSWDKGLIGLAEIIRAPFDKGYDSNNKRNFKIGLKMILTLKTVIKREDFRYYIDAYDAGGIGPNTRGEQNQAIKSLTDKQAFAVLRAMAENDSDMESSIRMNFDEMICNKIFGKMSCMIEHTMTFEEETQFRKELSADNTSNNNDNRKAYKAWLESLKEENGNPKFTDSYRSNLYTALNQVHNNHGMPNVYLITDVSEYREVKKYIITNPDFDAMNKDCGNRALKPSLDLYGEFLENQASAPLSRVNGGLNKIYYGAPGCGKSRYIKDMLKEAGVDNENIVRVTFHPEYANCDFVGQILPKVKTVIDETTGKKNEIVEYTFNPGPFTVALKKALETEKMVYLVIEEINRGNAAAIFGDLFQLLDRVSDTSEPDYSASEYPVTNVNIQDYLKDKITNEHMIAEIKDGIFIPGNLTILATMNSSDQNVFTLDTAFKRRWSFQQISNDFSKGKPHEYKDWFVPGTNVTWEKFLTEINGAILENGLLNQTNEDKRLGKYFVTKECLTEKSEDIADVRDTSALGFAYKVLEYIWNDVCKIGREEWFDIEKVKTLEDLIDAFCNPDISKDETPLSVFVHQKVRFGD